MGATRKPRTPVVNMGVGQEIPAEPPAVIPDGAQKVKGDNVSGDSPAPPTSTQDIPCSKDDDGSPKYPAEHFFKCNWYSHRRGELERLLEEDKTYSYAQIERMLSLQ